MHLWHWLFFYRGLNRLFPSDSPFEHRWIHRNSHACGTLIYRAPGWLRRKQSRTLHHHLLTSILSINERVLSLQLFRSPLQSLLQLEDLGMLIFEAMHDGHSLLIVHWGRDHAWKVAVHVLGLFWRILPLFTTLNHQLSGLHLFSKSCIVNILFIAFFSGSHKHLMCLGVGTLRQALHRLIHRLLSPV